MSQSHRGPGGCDLFRFVTRFDSSVFPLDSHSEEGDHVDEVRSVTVGMSVPQTQSQTLIQSRAWAISLIMMVILRWGIWNILFMGEEPAWIEEVLPTVVKQAAFASLDAVDLSDVFTRRARVLKSPPAFLKRSFRNRLRLSLQEAERGRAEVDEKTECPRLEVVSSLASIVAVPFLSWRHNTEKEIAGSIFSVRARRVVAVVAVEPGCSGVSRQSKDPPSTNRFSRAQG